MNKQEALYLPVIKEGLIFSTDSDECKRYYRTLDGEEVSSSFKAKSKEELLNQLKPVVPNFVAEWIEECKSKGVYLCTAMSNDENKTFYWLDTKEKQDIFARAWLDGYEVEKEKLYTVEIPNPNRISFTYALYRRNNGKIIIIGACDNCEEKKEYKLTESEIKQDFEWAWQWAKPVEDN